MKRYFVFFLFLLSFLATTSFVVAQSVLDIAQEEVTQTLDISNSDKAIILNMGTNAMNSDEQAFYNAPKFDLLFRLKYNKATKDSWDTNWEATVRFRLVRIAGTYPITNGVLDMSDVDIADGTNAPLFDPFNNLGDNGIMELKINQSNIEAVRDGDDSNDTNLSQVFVDYLVASKIEIDGDENKTVLPFNKDDLHNTSSSQPFTTAIQIISIEVNKQGSPNPLTSEEYMPVVDGSQDPIISFEVTPKPREVYGKVGNFVDAQEIQCDGSLCYREEFEELVWKKIENAHFYDLEWVFIDKYDSKTITTATAAFAHRRGVRIRTSDRHYLVRIGTELTYPEGRVFFRIRGIGKLKPEEDSEVLITTGQWNYAQTYLHLGEVDINETEDDNRVVKNIHEENRNWQYATVFAEEGKYKKVMSYFDPSLRSTQTLTNFTTDASRTSNVNDVNTRNDVTLVEESFYDYEGRAVVQTIPAPLHTSSLAHQSVNHDRVNFFENNDKGKYDNLANPSPALDAASLTASYYSANPVAEVDFSNVEKFKHQEFVPISNGFAYTQVRYTNDGTGRVKAQSGVGEAFQMGGGKEVKTFYLNPSEEELRRLFGNELGDISHYKKVLTIDPNGQKSVAYIDQAGQTIATGLVGESPEQLRALDASNIPDFSENLIKSNQRTGTVSRTEHTFYNPEENDYTLEYYIRGGTTSLMEEGEELCMLCEYELEINIIDEKGLPVNAVSNTTLPVIHSFLGEDVSEDISDCDDPGLGETVEGAITIILSGLPQGEYTIVKELRLTAGDKTVISDFAGRLMTQTSQDFRDASEDAAELKAKGDCLECTEVIEEDGTVTQSETSNNCLDYDGELYTDNGFHNLISEQLQDQCELDQGRYVSEANETRSSDDQIRLDEDLSESDLATNYSEIPLCILCVEDPNNPNLPLDNDQSELKKKIKNSYLYDSYMRGVKVRLDDGTANGKFINLQGTSTTIDFVNVDFGDPMNTDPFWELFIAEVGGDVASRWNNLETNNGQSIDQIIDLHINRDDNGDGNPDLSEEERKEQSWLIFQGFYQNFKRAHLKKFYQEMGDDCDPTAIDILLPELAGTNNINLNGLTLNNLAYTNPAIFATQDDDGQDMWEKTWLGYTGTANCTDWSKNMTVLLETKLGQCSQKWAFEQYISPSFTEIEAEELRTRIKEQFALYCGYQKDQPLANAFKKLYYSPYVKYDWLTTVVIDEIENISQDPNIPIDQRAWEYVEIYRGLVTQHPTSDLTIAFEAHFGLGSLDFDQTYWDTNYGTPEQAEIVRAYVESMIRAVSPSTGYLAAHDPDGNYNDPDEYSENVNTALEAIKSEIRTLDAGCISAFYAMLSIPDCKTHTYQEVEVPVDNPSEATVYNFDDTINPTNTTNDTYVGLQIDNNLTYDEYDQTVGYSLEATVIPDFPSNPDDGTEYIVFSTETPNESNSGNDESAGFEVGFVYREASQGYHIYQKMSVALRTSCTLVSDKESLQERRVESFSTVDVSQECHHFLLTDEVNPNINDGGTQFIYYDGVRINRPSFDVVKELGCGTGIFTDPIEKYFPRVFPLGIGTFLPKQNSTQRAKIAFKGIIREVRFWHKDANFNERDILPYRNNKLSQQQIDAFDGKLLGYWKMNELINPVVTVPLANTHFEDFTENNNDIEYIRNSSDQIDLTQQTVPECLKGGQETTTKSLYTCGEAYTFGDGVDLWGGRPLTPPTAEELQAECERITTDLLGDYTERLLVKQKEALEAKVEEEYRNQCFNSPFKEEMTLTYSKKEYHYTLYYYDQAGNLVQTVPPEGVVLDGTGQNHNLQTKYTYNTLGQVVWQETPDAGQSKFWIDYYGRVKLSQNAQQKEDKEYAYSKFDELGRPYEVGKLSSSGNLRLELEQNQTSGTKLIASEFIFDSEFPKAGRVTLLQENGGTPDFDFTLSQRTKTFYDKQEVAHPNGIDFIVNPNEQKNLKNRVAAVVVIEAEKTSEAQADQIGAITRYSYDIHGNVEKLWQNIPELDEKTVEYNYDLLSGKVNEVIYNRGGENDEFRHRYSYDGDNRLTEVETSLDGYHWTREASYFYYAHGPLARIETGEHNVQGTDYFYTLQGWIKGVNSIGLNAENDLGKDGYINQDDAIYSTFNKDEYAYTLNYFEGDYVARGSVDRNNDLLGDTFEKNEIYANFTGYQDELGNSPYKRESLYNGNIAAMTTSIGKMEDLAQPITQSMNYRYDQLHRIAAAEASIWDGNNWTHTAGKYRTSYKYDGNGNIKKLYRNNASSQRIDEITYDYIRNSDDKLTTNNRLLATHDATTDINGNPLTEGGLQTGKTYDYDYDKIGNLTQNLQDGIESIEWNIYGKVEKVTKKADAFGIQAIIEYKYDGTGNRIMKKVDKGSTVHTNYYLRDASGNVMAIYETIHPSETPAETNIAVKEIPIYGSTRLGQYRPFKDDLGQVNKDLKTALGQRIYEFANHLGNVLVTLTDNKVPQTDGTYKAIVLSASDYYPFGMAMKERSYQNNEYRFAFQGQERDEETGTDHYTYRQADPIIGRFWSVDPLSPKYPHNSPYAFSENRVLDGVELEGLEWAPYNADGEMIDISEEGWQDQVVGYNWVGYELKYQRGDKILNNSLELSDDIRNRPGPFSQKIVNVAPEGTVSEGYASTSENDMWKYTSDAKSGTGKIKYAELSQDNINEINTLDEETDMQPLAREFLLKAELDLDIPLRITEGFRSIETSNEYYARSRTQAELNAVGLNHVQARPDLPWNTNAYGGLSAHNYGLAFDIVGRTGGYNLDWQALGELGRSIGLDWGGDWVTSTDQPHFQLPNWRQHR